MRRPPILKDEKTLHENVKGLIYDREGNLIGVVINTEEALIIEFLGKRSPLIVFDKNTKEVELEMEVFPDDPKKVLERIVHG